MAVSRGQGFESLGQGFPLSMSHGHAYIQIVWTEHAIHWTAVFLLLHHT